MTPESIAAICHEAARIYYREIGEDFGLSYEHATWYQKQTALAQVLFIMDNPDAPLSGSHDSWLELRISEGWKYGTVKNSDKQEHPLILPYDQLPPSQKIKDRLFKSIVTALT